MLLLSLLFGAGIWDDDTKILGIDTKLILVFILYDTKVFKEAGYEELRKIAEDLIWSVFFIVRNKVKILKIPDLPNQVYRAKVCRGA